MTIQKLPKRGLEIGEDVILRGGGMGRSAKIRDVRGTGRSALDELPNERARIGGNQPPAEAKLPVERGAKPRETKSESPYALPKERGRGERHQVSNLVLRRPFEQMTSTKTETPGALLPETEFDWNKVPTGSWFTPLWGDRTWAGGQVTGVNETPFEKPVEMQGGSDFTRRPGNAIWASEAEIASALTNRMRRLQETGQDVYGIHSAMGGASGDFSQQTTKVINELVKANPLTEADAAKFDAAMRTDWKKNNKGEYDFPAVTDWPGINNLNDEWMANANGRNRAKVAKLLDTAGFPSGPDMGSVRKAVTKPSLVHSQIGDTGEAIVKAGPEAVKRITDPDLPHHDYASQVVGGEYQGKTTGGFPMQEFWTDWMKTRPAGEDISRSAFAFGRSPVVQKFTPEMQDRLMLFKKKGGTLAGAIAAGLITAADAQEIFGHTGDDEDALRRQRKL